MLMSEPKGNLSDAAKQRPAKPTPAAPRATEGSLVEKRSHAGHRVTSAQQEMDILIRARYPIIYVVTWEEERVERCLREIAAARNKNLFVWTITQGIVKS